MFRKGINEKGMKKRKEEGGGTRNENEETIGKEKKEGI